MGGAITFFIGHLLGRKRTLLAGTIICIIGAILQTVATSLGPLMAGRIVSGTGVGLLTSTIGVWQAETSPPKTRGRFLSLELLATTLGIFLAQWINYGFSSNTGRIAFLFPCAFQLVFIVFSGVLIVMLPESPHWLAKQGRREEMYQVLCQLRGKGATIEDPIVEERIRQMDIALSLENLDNKSQLRELFTNGPTQTRRRVLLACMIMAFHQLTGANCIAYFLPTMILQYLKSTRATALWVTGLTSVIALPLCFISILYIDKIGRRIFLIVGSAGQTVCFVVVTALLATAPAGGSAAYGAAVVFFIFLFNAFFYSCWISCTWVIPVSYLSPRESNESSLKFYHLECERRG